MEVGAGEIAAFLKEVLAEVRRKGPWSDIS